MCTDTAKIVGLIKNEISSLIDTESIFEGNIILIIRS